MSDAWDFGTAAGIQLLRAGISYLNIDVPYVLESVSFTLAVLEGSILSNTLPDRRRLTLYPAVILILRVVFDFTSSQDTLFAILGLVGTLAGLLMGPVFHSPDDDQNNDSQKSDLRARSGQGANTHVRRVLVPSRPVTLHTVDVDTETSRQVLFTPALSLRTLPESVTVPPTSITGGDGGGGGGMSSSNHSYTRVDESFSTDDTVRYSSHLRDTDLSAPEDVYHDSAERPVTVKDTVRKLRAQAKSDDVNRRNLLAEREQVLQEGDVSRAFLLKHQADSLKKSMQESDKEAAKLIFDYYNPPARRDRTRIDLRGLQASEAIKFVDEALTDLQEAGGNVLTITLGRSKNTDGPGKGKVKPTVRQYAKSQGINIRESEDGSTLILSLPTLRSPIGFD